MGADVPGDIQVVPAGERPREPEPVADLDHAAVDFSTLSDALDLHGLPGVQDKVSASMLSANLYLQFLFAWLTGNGDLHAKNVAVLRGASGHTVVSPMFDLPSTVLYGDMTMALPIAGRTRGIRARHWADFADSIRLPARAAESARRLALTAALSADITALPFTGSPLNGALRELRHRRAELA